MKSSAVFIQNHPDVTVQCVNANSNIEGMIVWVQNSIGRLVIFHGLQLLLYLQFLWGKIAKTLSDMRNILAITIL